MNTYLAIITTILVLTQIVRVTQNAIQLHRQRKEIDKTLTWFKDNDISERDFDVQRDVFYLLRDKLEREAGIDYGAEECDAINPCDDCHMETCEGCRFETVEET